LKKILKLQLIMCLQKGFNGCPVKQRSSTGVHGAP